MSTRALTPLLLLAPLALLAACDTESGTLPSGPQPGITAHRVSSDWSPWSEPVNLGPVVNGDSWDEDPALSPDELSLYFASSRPGGFGIWVTHRDCRRCPWKTPVKLRLVPDAFEPDLQPVLSPELSPDGHLLFFGWCAQCSQFPDDNLDLYVAKRADTHDDFGWGPPEPVGAKVNTAAREMDPAYLDAGIGGPYLYFAREFTPLGYDFDIFAVPITRAGKARGPAVLVAELRPPDWAPGQVAARNPTLRADGKEMIFYSQGRVDDIGGAGGPGGLRVSTRNSIRDPWSTPLNLGVPPNWELGGDFEPALSHDGRTLIFASQRPGGQGSNDLWMSTRTRVGDEHGQDRDER